MSNLKNTLQALRSMAEEIKAIGVAVENYAGDVEREMARMETKTENKTKTKTKTNTKGKRQ